MIRRLRQLSRLISYLLYGQYKIKDVSFLDNTETIRMIITEGKSLARFGDGEFGLIIQDKSAPAFQKGSDELSSRLKQVLSSSENSLILGIPSHLFDRSGLKLRSVKFWVIFMSQRYREIDVLLRRDAQYADTQITRPYISFKKGVDFGAKFESLKQIWKHRDVLIVEGARTYFGVGNDLLDGANSVKRILCPAENAFESYGQIYTVLVNTAKKSDLILACLGPTATILAYDLSRIGYQVIDIGHLDIEYEWYLQRADATVPVMGKYTNEAGYKGSDDMSDEHYSSSIVVKIEEENFPYSPQR